MFGVREIARLANAQLLRGTGERPRRVIHDSRLVERGDLFVALPGKRTDGHRFLEQAFARGACGALLSDPAAAPESARNLILVTDTLQALGTLAAAWREELDAQIVGITGSNGKTTTKALLAHLLGQDRIVHTAAANYNTEIGVPLSLLSMPRSAEIGVFELGTQAPGEIQPLAEMLRPTIGILTNIGPSHLVGLGTLEAVADEKWHLVDALAPNGSALINADCPLLRARAETGQANCVTVGVEHGTVRGRILRTVPHLEIEMGDPQLRLHSQLLGRHNATNLLLAVACATTLGLPAASAEERTASFVPVPHRLQALARPFGTVLDDTYNANPSSTAAALEVLSQSGNVSSRRIFVFGEMLDLGAGSARFHRKIAELAVSLGIDAILPVGIQAERACRALGSKAFLFEKRQHLPSRLRSTLVGDNNIVLVKGSRALGLERLVDALGADPG